MKKLTYIFFAISLLLFSCKAMDFVTVKDEENFVSIQYYNFKPVSQTLVNFNLLLDTYSINFIENKDTLVLDFTIRKKEDIKPISKIGESLVILDSCHPMTKLKDGDLAHNGISRLIGPDRFYQVYFPILEVENVERKDLGKWYRSFSTIIVNVQKTASVEQFVFTNPHFLFLVSSYTRP